jgi:3-hydroxyacyl-[acyl-carrier-protein] dehydratase
MVQIVREVMEAFAACPLSIVASDNMKFMAVIDPIKDPDVDVRINFTQEEDVYQVNASIFLGAVIFFKMKANFSKVQWN